MRGDRRALGQAEKGDANGWFDRPFQENLLPVAFQSLNWFTTRCRLAVRTESCPAAAAYCWAPFAVSCTTPVICWMLLLISLVVAVRS